MEKNYIEKNCELIKKMVEKLASSEWLYDFFDYSGSYYSFRPLWFGLGEVRYFVTDIDVERVEYVESSRRIEISDEKTREVFLNLFANFSFQTTA